MTLASTGKKTPRSAGAVGPSRAISDDEDLLALLAEAAVPNIVIGGCAVGVYARRVAALNARRGTWSP